MTATLNPLSQKNFIRDFLVRISNSRFFTISLLLHLLLVILFGGKAIFDAVQDEPDMIATEAGQFVSSDPNPAPPAPPAQPQQSKPEFQVKPVQPMNAPAALSAITTLSQSSSMSMPSMLTSAPTKANKPMTADIQSVPSVSAKVDNTQLSKETLMGIAGFTSSWATGGGGGSLKSRKFKFTAYLAKYSGGDWSSSVWINNGKITGGSLPNLLFLMKKMSQDKVEATPDAQPLDLASDQIFVVKPPFIFFTGHRDFVLSDKEIENLRKYIRLGGAVWGDSSLPGNRSRFDIAFRREMKRVIPDLDKQFEILPPDHDIYTKTYYPEIHEAPPGLNYYQEPVYALKYNGEIAVLYTANDYGDMWQIGLDARWKVDYSEDEHHRRVAMNKGMWDIRDTYYRGLTEENLGASFKFGTNIVIHLLTRWEDKVRGVRAL